MTRLIQTIKQVFEEQELSCIDIPEWPNEDGTPSKIYFKKITLGDYAFLQKRTEGDPDLLVIELLVLKALDKNGERVFTLEDKQKLMRGASIEVVLRLSSIMTKESGI